MDFEIKDIGGVRELCLRGRLTFEANGAFRTIVETVGAGARSRTIVDLSRLDFIDSAGLGMLILLKEACGNLLLRAPKGQVQRLLAASRFDAIVPFARES